MRIGDLLLEQRKLRQSELTKVLEEQPTTSRRLCSLLIARGLIDFDDGARALGDQKGVPCALAKHLANRDPALAKLFPPELGRAVCALPIGKTNGGALIVCVRDPEPPLLAALQQAARTTILMVIAPATRLEHLVAAAYGASPSDELDIDFDLGAEPVDARPPPPPASMDLLDPISVRLALTDLDDTRVAKDPMQSGQIALRTGPRSTLPPMAPTFEQTRLALGNATSREAATDLVIAHVAGRWVTGVIVAIREGTAIGYRGHGVQNRGGVEAIALPLGLPSTVQRATQTRRLSGQMPAGPAQEQLSQILGIPLAVVAAPVLVGGEAVAVIAVGDSIHGAHDLETSSAELGGLAETLGATYDRIRRESSR